MKNKNGFNNRIEKILRGKVMVKLKYNHKAHQVNNKYMLSAYVPLLLTLCTLWLYFNYDVRFKKS